VIRGLSGADAAELLELQLENREFLAPFEPHRPPQYYTVAGQKEWIAVGVRFAIVRQGAMVGTISLTNILRGPLQSASLGYWVARQHNGSGFATSAVSAVLRHAFERMQLHRVEAGTLPDNVASQKVLLRNGFREIGTARRYLYLGGRWCDHKLFERLADD
jgi:[ribosomal protein S5]-alanine N-acetyltransferase